LSDYSDLSDLSNDSDPDVLILPQGSSPRCEIDRDPDKSAPMDVGTSLGSGFRFAQHGIFGFSDGEFGGIEGRGQDALGTRGRDGRETLFGITHGTGPWGERIWGSLFGLLFCLTMRRGCSIVRMRLTSGWIRRRRREKSGGMRFCVCGF
jgi:hypothetical protein